MRDGDRTALLVVDVQNDFCHGGALAVPDGDRVVDALNQYIDYAVARGVTVYASRDWHPAVTRHFKSQGGPWPAHCVPKRMHSGFKASARRRPNCWSTQQNCSNKSDESMRSAVR